MNKDRDELQECPKCLGEGEYYSPLEDNVVKCSLCKGVGKISQRLAETYDPIADELTDLMFGEDDE
jgi:DnaJ-class molecular chaperone